MTMKSLLTLFILVKLHLANGDQLRGTQQHDLQAPGSLLCKIYTEGTIYEDVEATEEQVCAPIIDGAEAEQLIPLKLPREIQDAHQYEIRQGLLLVLLTHAEIIRNDFDVDIAVHSDNEFVVVDDDPRFRYLRERKLQTTGTITVAVVLISGKNSRPTATKADIENTFNDNLVNIKTQYDLCSGGKLKLQKASKFVSEVTVSTNVGSGTTPASLIAEASEKLGGAEKLADKVLFCIPPGTGSWAASSSMNYWRAQFNDPFCTSVSAMVHEFGHLIGLPHSGENGDRYGDSTGYMSRSFRNANWPRRCFNGANSGFLGWYKDKTLEMSENDGPRLVKLAGAVDYEKAADDEPVLIDLGNGKWIQYNRAKWFTKDTGEYPDHVIITRMLDGGTDVLGTVLPGETFTSSNFKVKSCKRVTGVNDNNADYMLISVGKGTALACPDSDNSTNNSNNSDNGNNNNNDNNGNNGDGDTNNNKVEQSQEKETPFPTEAPIQATKAPTMAPTNAPTMVPTNAPTMAPTKVPANTSAITTNTGAPTEAPSDADGDEPGKEGNGNGESEANPVIIASTGSKKWWKKLWSLPKQWFSFPHRE